MLMADVSGFDGMGAKEEMWTRLQARRMTDGRASRGGPRRRRGCIHSRPVQHFFLAFLNSKIKMPTSPHASSSRLSDDGADDMCDSELFEELERELDDDAGPEGGGFDMGEYRERRMAQLKEE